MNVTEFTTEVKPQLPDSHSDVFLLGRLLGPAQLKSTLLD